VAEPDEEDEGPRPLPDRLLSELTQHRTLALRDALASDPDTAFLAALHVLCLKLFYRYGLDSCLEIEPKSAVLGAQAPGLADTASARAIDARHAAWAAQLPREPEALWDTLMGFDLDSRQTLFAHCVALTVNAVHEAYNRRPRALAHADRIAEAVRLDMAASGWRATAESYLGRVTKARILDAVREARGDAAAKRIAQLKKAEMAAAAEELLAGTGWLPEPLRTPGQRFTPAVDAAPDSGAAGEAQSAANGGEPAMAPTAVEADTVEAPAPTSAIAAE
jgi:ParB family chromosome partitioning protein